MIKVTLANYHGSHHKRPTTNVYIILILQYEQIVLVNIFHLTFLVTIKCVLISQLIENLSRNYLSKELTSENVTDSLVTPVRWKRNSDLYPNHS